MSNFDQAIAEAHVRELQKQLADAQVRIARLSARLAEWPAHAAEHARRVREDERRQIRERDYIRAQKRASKLRQLAADANNEDATLNAAAVSADAELAVWRAAYWETKS